MKSVTVRLPDALVAKIASEAKLRRVSKSKVIRDRLERQPPRGKSAPNALELIQDLLGSVKNLPKDMSARTDYYLSKGGYGKVRGR